MYGHFRAAGLADVAVEGRLMIRPGDPPGARLDQANFIQIRDPLIAAGSLSAAEADQVLRLLEDPRCPISSPMLFTA